MSSSLSPVARRRAFTAAHRKSTTATPGTSTGAWKLDGETREEGRTEQ